MVYHLSQCFNVNKNNYTLNMNGIALPNDSNDLDDGADVTSRT